MAYFVPAASHGFAAAVSVRDVALFTVAIVKICGGDVRTRRVCPARTALAAAVKFVPVPVTPAPAIAIVPAL